MTLENFIETIHPVGATGTLCLFTLPAKRSYYYNKQEHNLIAEDVERLKDQNLFFSVCTTKTSLPRTKRISKQDVAELLFVSVDIDIADSDAHKQQRLPNSLDEVLKLLKESPLPEPTFIVDSGYGIHVHWVPTMPFDMSTEADLALAERVTKGFNRILAIEAEKHDWKLDQVGDLARVMRLPSSRNHKKGEGKLVQILQSNNVKYDFDEMLKIVEDNDRLELPKVETCRLWDTEVKKSDKKSNYKSVLAGCYFVQHCVDNAETLKEPEWYAFLTIAARCKDGVEVCHTASKPYSGYSETETDNKIKHALNDAPGPATCAFIESGLNFSQCKTCPLFRTKLKSPISLGRYSPAMARLLSRWVYCLKTNQFFEVRL